MRRSWISRLLSLLACFLVLLPAQPCTKAEDIAQGAVFSFPKEKYLRLRPVKEEELELHFINVYGADCILVRTGEYTLLIDSGTVNTTRRVLAYLAYIGVESIDYAFVSHPHDDHIGGYIGLFDAIPVGRILWADTYENFDDEYSRRFFKAAEANGIPIDIVRADTEMALGNATLTFLQCADSTLSENDRSMALKLTFGARSALFMADISGRGQTAFLAKYGEADILKADLLKMPHHGLTNLKRELHDFIQPSVVTFSNFAEAVETQVSIAKGRGAYPVVLTKGTLIAETDGEAWRLWQVPTGP